MKSGERQQAIINMIPYNGYLIVKDLSETFQVSSETIRRDLAIICANNPSIKKNYGGVYRTDIEDMGTPQKLRQNLLIKEKSRFADYCISLINPRDCILLDSSTTSQFIATAICEHNIPVRLITNSIQTAGLFSDKEEIEVILLGGRLRKSNGSLVGAFTCTQIGKYFADIAFLSPTAISDTHGLMDNHTEEAAVREQMLKCSKKKILVADHTKFGTSAHDVIAPLTELTQVVTDTTTTQEWIGILEALKIPVIRC